MFAYRLAAFPEDAVAFLIERACERHALWCPERWTVSYANRGYFGLEGRFGIVYIEGPGAQRRSGSPRFTALPWEQLNNHVCRPATSRRDGMRSP